MYATDSLGVDIGGLIIDRVNERNQVSFFSDDYLDVPPVPGAFDALRRLTSERFGERIHPFSKCSDHTRVRTLAWMERHDVYEATGILPTHVHFCTKRHELELTCRALRLTHVVGERLEVLASLRMRHRYLLGGQPYEVKRYALALKAVRVVENWEQLLKEVLH